MRILEHASTSEEYIQALYYIGVTAPQEFNADVFQVLNEGLTHSDPAIREAALGQ
ncbi:MAG: hypothetical protein ACOCXT_06225 [Candidatus Dojkabacteria bacterium]